MFRALLLSHGFLTSASQMPTALINVSNRLPITVAADGTVTKSSGGLVAALEGLPAEQSRPLWIGWPGSEIEQGQQQRLATRLQADFACLPVFLSNAEEHGFYEGFANSSVWPLLHYITNHFRYEPQWWDDYLSVNRKFADVVVSVAHDGDLIWVHDYQLMLLPAMLKEAQ